MITGILHSKDGPMLLVGLSGENMTRLMAQEPILIEVDKFGFSQLPNKILIVGGRTEETMRDELQKHFGTAKGVDPKWSI